MELIAPPSRSAPKHPRYDAIHRALLTGLLSNVGTKSDTHEYLGTRGVRFHIFPGSALFHGGGSGGAGAAGGGGQKQKWIMGGELVETTKLYARTCAGIQPQWIELAAAHLVERAYSEPRWDNKTGSVLATEKVSLHGLVLIPARTVPFSPINPRLAREMFIHNALVLGDYRGPGGQDAAYARHNAALVAEVELLEAKIRQRNLLADAATRFAFYDARVPLEVTNAAEFDLWRRRVERGNPRLLFMEKADLLRADAPAITPENYPDRLSDRQGNLKLPLVYRFEPGEVSDGLTLAVPVAALAHLRPERYEWLVPGMLEDKIATMLRELPGALRRNFVPVPTWAKSAAEYLLPLDRADSNESLRDALAGYLAHQTGVEIRGSDFADAALPPHMRMSFKVLDDEGKVLAVSRDLPVLQRKLAPQTAGSFATIRQREFNRDGITTWDFGDLPESVTVQRFGMSIVAYPALVENNAADAHGDVNCSLRLLPSREAADDAHRGGVRRLFRLAHRREVKALGANLPHFVQMALQHFTLGESRVLREDLITLIVDRALFGRAEVPRTRGGYEAVNHGAAGRLAETSEETATLVGTILQNYHELTLVMEESSHTWGPALSDVREQLAYLMPPHFLLTTPWDWLVHVPRYVTGMRQRLLKLQQVGRGGGGGGSAMDKDLEAMEAVAPWWNQYLQRKAQHDAVGLRDAELALFRWMVEEFRVVRFTQELGAAVQVSPKRLEKQWLKVR